MAVNLKGLVENMIQDEQFQVVMNNPLAQLGPADFPLLGATLMPEENQDQNSYTEEKINFRTVIANDGTRYSPVQKKGSVLTGSMNVILGNSDIGSEFTGQDYDAMIRLLERYAGASGASRPPMTAITTLLDWTDRTLRRPLDIKNEKQRWEAIVYGQVVRTGDNGYKEIVNYPNPAGHRVAAAGTWSNNSYDPYTDIIAMAEFLARKGYRVSRIITSTTVTSILALNTFIRTRVGRLSLAGGTVVGLSGRATLADLNQMLSDDDLPPIEKYDAIYRTQNGTAYYLPRNVFVMACTTGRDARIDLGDAEPIVLRDTLGYVGVGRPVGRTSPGRQIVVNEFENKPPRIEGEAWQTTLPVLTEPEALGVLTTIS